MLLNTVDVHALSHVIDGDDHNTIEHCENCEDFILTHINDFHVVVNEVAIPTPITQFRFQTSIRSHQVIAVNQQKYLGKHHNKPPPFTN